MTWKKILQMNVKMRVIDKEKACFNGKKKKNRNSCSCFQSMGETGQPSLKSYHENLINNAETTSRIISIN